MIAVPMQLPRETRWPLILYNTLFPFVLVGMLPKLVLRMLKRGKYGHKFGQRFGLYSDKVRRELAGKSWTWVRAVSVGECLLALKLISELQSRDPSLHVALSTTTSTGFGVASQSTSPTLHILYSPIDVPFAVRRALDLLRPARIVFIEGEVWPNLAAQAKRRSIPMILANARISPRSEKRFLKFRKLAGPIFRLLDVVCAQDADDVGRWKRIGVSEEKIRRTGSIKFDNQTSGDEARIAEFRGILEKLGVSNDAPILLGGSTFPGEERVLAQVFRSLRVKFPNLFLILVPRHFERTPEILKELQPLDLEIIRRTALPSNPNSSILNPKLLLVDTTGELRDWYHTATVVFIGKSLDVFGGQNPVEAVAAGKPVIYGPHMENFQAIADRWVREDAAIRVSGEAELESAVTRLLENPELRHDMARRAAAAVAEHTGAIERTAGIVEKFGVEKHG